MKSDQVIARVFAACLLAFTITSIATAQGLVEEEIVENLDLMVMIDGSEEMFLPSKNFKIVFKLSFGGYVEESQFIIPAQAFVQGYETSTGVIYGIKVGPDFQDLTEQVESIELITNFTEENLILILKASARAVVEKLTTAEETSPTSPFEPIDATKEMQVTVDDTVTFVGFGTFSVTRIRARKGRNPQTGAPIMIKAKKVVKFKAGKSLEDAV